MELYEKFKRIFSLITLHFPQAHFYINHNDTGAHFALDIHIFGTWAINF